MSKILYIVPRFHTNLVPIVKKLKEKHSVDIMVSYKGDTEHYDLLKPIVITPFNKKTNLKKEVEHSDTWPKPIQLFKTIRSINPDIVIVRGINKHTIFSLIVCRFLSLNKILFYDQSPVYLLKTSTFNKFKMFIKWLFFHQFIQFSITILNF